jgi:TrmH family RNA methyltransferase
MSAACDWRGVAEAIRRAATRRGRSGSGCSVVEGVRLHERALRGGAAVDSVLLGESFRVEPGKRGARLIGELRIATKALVVAPDDAVRELTEGRETGLVGLIRIPGAPGLRELLRRPTERPQALLVGVEIEDPGNVGALTRTALASGARALVGVGMTDPWHPRAVRTSRGSVFKLPLPLYDTAGALLAELRSAGVRCLGMVSSGGTALDELVFDTRTVAFFLGSEAFGLTSELKGDLEDRVTVPMVCEVDSFSVNAAAAVALYEFYRQTRQR